MPKGGYASTDGNPDYELMVATADPKHMTRRPRSSHGNNHVHTQAPSVANGDKIIPGVGGWDDVHKVTVTYWEVATPRVTNAVCVACNDPAVEWHYDPYSARQTARAYVRDAAKFGGLQTTNIVKTSLKKKKWGKKPHTIAMHPDAWDEIRHGRDEISGDIVARMHRVGSATERNAIATRLRGGCMILAYVLE